MQLLPIVVATSPSAMPQNRPRWRENTLVRLAIRNRSRLATVKGRFWPEEDMG